MVRFFRKKKRKGKRGIIEQPIQDDRMLFSWFRLFKWFWFDPERLARYGMRSGLSEEDRDLWKLTAFLTYVPITVGLIGFVLGSMPETVALWLRLVLAALFIPVLGIAWRATAKLTHLKSGRWRAGWAALLSSLIFVFIVCIPCVAQGNTNINWVLLLVGLASTANLGLIRGISKVIRGSEHRLPVWGFEGGLQITSVVMLAATVFTIGKGGGGSGYICGFSLGMMCALPILSPAAVVMTLLFSAPFSFRKRWERQEDEYLSDRIILGILFQIGVSAALTALYGSLIVMSLFGSLM
jgi:hypothetical protein